MGTAEIRNFVQARDAQRKVHLHQRWNPDHRPRLAFLLSLSAWPRGFHGSHELFGTSAVSSMVLLVLWGGSLGKDRGHVQRFDEVEQFSSQSTEVCCVLFAKISFCPSVGLGEFESLVSYP